MLIEIHRTGHISVVVETTASLIIYGSIAAIDSEILGLIPQMVEICWATARIDHHREKPNFTHLICIV